MPKQKGSRTKIPNRAGIYKLTGARGVRYEAVWRAPDPDTGKRRQFSQTFAKLEEAATHLDTVRKARHDGTFVPASKGRRTFGELFASHLQELENKGRKARTIDGYRRIFQVWLKEWEHRPIASLRRADVQGVVAKVKAAGRKPQTMHNVFTVMHATFRHAVKEKCITVNPALDERSEMLPSQGRTREPNPLTVEQVNALAAAAPSHALLIRFAAWSGLRAAELAGLRVRDVYVRHAEVQVCQTARYVRAGEWVVGTPKSKHSTDRYVPIPPALARLVQGHIDDHGLQPDDFLFGEDGGRVPLRHGAFYRQVFQRAARAIGVPHLRAHDLRHTFAALKLGQGYGLHEVKEWMGHSSINVTVDLYGKLVRKDDEARRARDDAAFLSAGPDSNVVPLRRAG